MWALIAVISAHLKPGSGHFHGQSRGAKRVNSRNRLRLGKDIRAEKSIMIPTGPVKCRKDCGRPCTPRGFGHALFASSGLRGTEARVRGLPRDPHVVGAFPVLKPLPYIMHAGVSHREPRSSREVHRRGPTHHDLLPEPGGRGPVSELMPARHAVVAYEDRGARSARDGCSSGRTKSRDLHSQSLSPSAGFRYQLLVTAYLPVSFAAEKAKTLSRSPV